MQFMKKESKTKKIGEVVNAFYKKYNLLKTETNESIFNLWKDIIGVHIYSKTNNIFFKKNIIYIHVEDEIVKKELIRQKNKLKDSFDKKIQNLKEVKII